MVTHKHHIIPRHMGGSDDPENIVTLPFWAHTEVHKRLYEVYGRAEDKLAYLMMTGKKEEAEVVRIQLAKEGYQRWLVEKPEEVKRWRENINKAKAGKCYHSKEHYQKLGDMFRDVPRTEEVKEKISKSKKGKPWNGNREKIQDEYEVTKPNGDVIIIRGLVAFCKEEGIDSSNLCAVAKGRLKQHKGYRARKL